MCIRKVAATVEIGNSSVGNAILPTSAALDVMALDARNMDSENAVHGQKATARKGTNPTPSMPAMRALKMVVKTKA